MIYHDYLYRRGFKEGIVIRILIVDDEEVSREATKTILNHYDVEIVGEAESGLTAMLLIKENPDIDLVMLDIEMKNDSGFDIAEYINNNFPSINIVFLTGHVGFALDGYRFEPMDFLTKPINVMRLEKVLQKVNELKNNDIQINVEKIGIHVEGGYDIINVDDILYIEKRLRKIYLVMKGTEKVISKYSMEKLEMIFEKYDFVRVYQSFLVPAKHIASIYEDGNRVYYVTLDNAKVKIPLSRNKYVELKEGMEKRGILFY